MTLVPGARLGPYEIVSPLGAGGMGEVYRARDARVDRLVALKVLPEEFLEGEESKARFAREARTLASLNHPNVAVLYSFEEIPGTPSSPSRHILVMELLEGEPLSKRIKAGATPVREALAIARDIAAALEAAHAKGIVHRDLKPGNVMVSPDGRVKLLDFGLAKASAAPSALPDLSQAPTETDARTRTGVILGTAAYMSPEQARGLPVDKRTDLWAFGVVVWEMLTGKRLFRGPSTPDTLAAVLREPIDLKRLPLSTPQAVRALLAKCLERDPEKRLAEAGEARRVLDAVLASGTATRPPARTLLAAAALLLIALAGGIFVLRRQASREHHAISQISEITRLIEAQEFGKAAALIKEAQAVLVNDPALEKQWLTATGEATIDSDPPGADVSIRPYKGVESDWRSIGKTPLKRRVPKGWYVWRITKPGFATITFVDAAESESKGRLLAAAAVPSGMVPVPVDEMTILPIPGLLHLPGLQLADYLIDRTEVTNEDYRKFVEAGGYERREYWKQPFVKGGRALGWEEAVRLFRDATGRPGPATWEVGSFPPGQEKHPVAGVSWYEAAAYAEFAGKSLPTIYHWTWAGQTWLSMLIVPGSNFLGAGTQAVGAPGALSGFGTSDMAGNVKEWCWNEAGDGRRYLLGGGFGEPGYLFPESDTQSPWDRRPTYGFRCVKLASPPPPAAAARIERVYRDFTKVKAVSDEVFAAYKGLYAYDRTDPHARVEETEPIEFGTRQRVSFDAAYGGERVTAHLYLPKNVSPPFQPVVYFPGSDALMGEKFDTSRFAAHPVVQSGRALVIPIYKSTYERRDGVKSDSPQPTAAWRDHMIMWSKDLGRTLDYLETRKDLDASKMAYWGFSWGTSIAPILLAVDQRFKAAVLLVGGLEFPSALPEADPINFAPRVRTPALMVNGRFDNTSPLASSQLPFFQRLGTPDKDKKHVVLEAGHLPPRHEYIRASLDWLDEYLGPVKR